MRNDVPFPSARQDSEQPESARQEATEALISDLGLDSAKKPE